MGNVHCFEKGLHWPWSSAGKHAVIGGTAGDNTNTKGGAAREQQGCQSPGKHGENGKEYYSSAVVSKQKQPLGCGAGSDNQDELASCGSSVSGAEDDEVPEAYDLDDKSLSGGGIATKRARNPKGTQGRGDKLTRMSSTRSMKNCAHSVSNLSAASTAASPASRMTGHDSDTDTRLRASASSTPARDVSVSRSREPLEDLGSPSRVYKADKGLTSRARGTASLAGETHPGRCGWVGGESCDSATYVSTPARNGSRTDPESTPTRTPNRALLSPRTAARLDLFELKRRVVAAEAELARAISGKVESEGMLAASERENGMLKESLHIFHNDTARAFEQQICAVSERLQHTQEDLHRVTQERDELIAATKSLPLRVTRLELDLAEKEQEVMELTRLRGVLAETKARLEARLRTESSERAKLEKMNRHLRRKVKALQARSGSASTRSLKSLASNASAVSIASSRMRERTSTHHASLGKTPSSDQSRRPLMASGASNRLMVL